MQFQSKKIPLFVLGILAFVSSRAVFLFINDPEGPNLLVVTVLAAILYVLSLPVFFFTVPASGLKRFLLTAIAQALIATGLYFLLV